VKSCKNAILHPILRVYTKTGNVAPLFPLAPRVKQVLAYWLLHSTHNHTVWLTRRTKPRSSSFFIFFQSFTQVNNTEPEKIKIPKSLNPCSPSLSRPSSSNQPSVHHQQATTVFFTSHHEMQISDNNNGGSPVTSLHQP
jgi:hypothetical protein